MALLCCICIIIIICVQRKRKNRGRQVTDTRTNCTKFPPKTTHVCVVYTCTTRTTFTWDSRPRSFPSPSVLFALLFSAVFYLFLLFFPPLVPSVRRAINNHQRSKHTRKRIRQPVTENPLSPVSCSSAKQYVVFAFNFDRSRSKALHIGPAINGRQRRDGSTVSSKSEPLSRFVWL